MLRRGKNKEERRIAIYLVKVLSGKKNVEVGRYFRIKGPAVSGVIKAIEERLEKEENMLGGTGRLMAERWAIWIDIEGFRALYHRETLVLEALGELMEGIFLIGKKCYPETPNRIFAHQTGDGFVIVSEFGASSLEVPVAISIALLQHVAARGRFAKASIGEGNFADILGCYPKQIRDACHDASTVRLGGGLMTLFPVMGTALIDAASVAKRSPTGALLTLARENWERLPNKCIVRKADCDIISVDWVHSELPIVTKLQSTAGLSAPNPEQVQNAFIRYRSHGPSDEWILNTMSQLGFAVPPNQALQPARASEESNSARG